MALKDCTFTVTIDGKTRTLDYTGFRAFLLTSKNLAAVAPSFAGTGKQSKSGSGPTVLQQAESNAMSPVDPYEDIQALRDVSSVPPVAKSKHSTGAEARRGLEELAKNAERQTEGSEAYRAFIEARKALREGTRGKTKEQVAKLEAAFIQARDTYRQELAKRRLIYIDEIAPGGMADITYTPYQTIEEVITTGQYSSTIQHAERGVNKDANWRIQHGVDIFRRLVGNHPELQGRTIDIRLASPSDADKRPHYTSLNVKDLASGMPKAAWGKGHIMLQPYSHTGVIVHELGHWMEDCSDDIARKIRAFLVRRAGTEELQSLQNLSPGRSFRASEVAVRDNFIDPYIGKYYGASGGRQGDWSQVVASEVLSMGLQYMYEDPLTFARKDPEMFDLIFDIVRME